MRQQPTQPSSTRETARPPSCHGSQHPCILHRSPATTFRSPARQSMHCRVNYYHTGYVFGRYSASFQVMAALPCSRISLGWRTAFGRLENLKLGHWSDERERVVWVKLHLSQLTLTWLWLPHFSRGTKRNPHGRHVVTSRYVWV